MKPGQEPRDEHVAYMVGDATWDRYLDKCRQDGVEPTTDDVNLIFRYPQDAYDFMLMTGESELSVYEIKLMDTWDETTDAPRIACGLSISDAVVVGRVGVTS